MEKRQGIRWKACGNAGLRGTEQGERGASFVGEVLLDAVCALIFLCATRTMIADVYQWGTFDFRAYVMIGIGALGCSFAMEYARGVKETLVRKLRWAVLGVGLIGFLYWLSLGENATVIRVGWIQMAEEFIRDWNSYYGTNFATSGLVGSGPKRVEALDYLLLLTFFVLLWLAKRYKMNLLLAIPAVAVFVLELMVGYSAGEKGIFLMAAGLLLANSSPWYGSKTKSLSGAGGSALGMIQRFSWVFVGIAVILSLSMVKTVGTPSADKIVHSAEDIRDWFDELFSDIPKGGNGDGSGEGGGISLSQTLTNETPEYRYVPVFSISMDGSPQGTMYFKGIYADVYRAGEWAQDMDAFNSLLERTGMSEGELSGLIASREVTALAKNYQVESLKDSMFSKQMRIAYESAFAETIYLPYFSEVSHEQISSGGDGLYYRTGLIKTLDLTVWYYENQFQDRLELLAGSAHSQTWSNLYDEYVMEHYLDVPEELIAVRDIAGQFGGGTLIGGYSVNDLRLYRAKQVVNWLEENTEYSLELPELPEGTDPIEFFLLNSRSGYCMHYASAGTMLLRAMGVPARMAIGYVVGANSFTTTQDGDWTSTVLDSQAHAWVEVYLTGIGWVPMEMTKGYRNGVPDMNPYDDDTLEDPDNTLGSEAPETTEGQSDFPDLTMEDPDNTLGSEAPETTGGGPDVTIPVESTDAGGNGGGSVKNIRKFIRPLLIVIGVLLVITVIVYVIIRIRHEYREQLMREIRKKHMSRAVQIMNRRIYRKLRLTGKVMKPDLRDDGYEEILKKTYTEILEEDWEKYMEIAKKAAFSEQEFSTEEVEFVYGIYRKVKPRS